LKKILASILLGAALLQAPTLPAQDEMSGIYVATFDLNTQTKCDAIIDDILNNGNINAVFVEIRGRADAYYYPNREDSTYPNNEPRGELYTISPSDLDVLQYFIDRMHTASPPREVHAWLTTFNTWNRVSPPSSPDHVFNAHPEWITEDSAGVTYSDSSDDAPLDPGIPAVQDYIYNVFMDVVRNYDIDGIHFDYVRLINSDAGFDPVALSEFERETGFVYDPAGTTPELDEVYEAWRRDQISQIVESVTRQTRLEKPNVQTSAFLVNFSDSIEQLAQGYNWWVAHDAIDFLAPGCYSSSVSGTEDDYDFYLSKLAQNGDENKIRIYPAIGSYLLPDATEHNSAVTTLRANTRPAEGFVFFDYGALYVDGTPDDDFADGLFTASGPMDTYEDVPDYPYLPGNDNTAPNAPTNLSVSVSGDGIPTVAFDRPVAAGDGDLPVQYRLYRDTQSPVRLYYENMVMEWWDPGSPRASFSFDDVTADGNVYYAAVAYDDWHNEAATGTMGPYSATSGEIIIRSVEVMGVVNSSGYSESGMSGFSSVKSQAPNAGSVQQTRYSTNSVISASYTITPTIPASGEYDIYVTTPVAGSVDAPNSPYTITHPSGPTNGTVNLTSSNSGDTWATVAEDIMLSAGTGNSITFSETTGQPNRFYADAVRFVPNRTPTPKEPKPAVVQPAAPTAPLEIIVDSHPQALDYDDFGGTGAWQSSSLSGYYDSNSRFYSSGNTFPMEHYSVWVVDLPVAGEWQIDGWVRNNTSFATGAQYRITDESDTVINTVASQQMGPDSTTSGGWFINVDGVSDGSGLDLRKGRNYVTLYGNTGGAQTVIADALRFTLVDVSSVSNWEVLE